MAGENYSPWQSKWNYRWKLVSGKRCFDTVLRIFKLRILYRKSGNRSTRKWSNRSHVYPALLSPSPRAAYHHSLRVYHQLKVWRTLSNSDLKPLSWGWQKKNDMFSPVMTNIAAAPENVLKIIRCSCKGSCNRRCSSRKAGLTCTSSCKKCCGMTCTNTTVVFDDELGEGEERHFMDAFAWFWLKCVYILLELKTVYIVFTSLQLV